MGEFFDMWAGQGWPKSWAEYFDLDVDADVAWPIRDKENKLIAVCESPESQRMVWEALEAYMKSKKESEKTMGIKLALSNICSAFADTAIGSKVKPECREDALRLMEQAVSLYTFPESGQGFIVCPDLIPLVLSGDAPKSVEVSDYVLRKFRGEVQKFLRRECANNVEVSFCALVVYTKDAYLKDPDVVGDAEAGIPRDEEELNRVETLDCTHVLVALLASGGPKPTVSPGRFVLNLAGGNNDYKNMSGDDLRALAADIKANMEKSWCTVAD